MSAFIHAMKRRARQRRQEAERKPTGVGTTARLLHEAGKPHIQQNCVRCISDGISERMRSR